MPLEKQIEKQAHISHNLDSILDKMRSMSSDDMARELVASGLEAGAFAIAFRGVGTISSLAKKQLQATAELMQDSARGAKVLSTAEGLKISINALDAEIVKIEESIARITASTAENSVKTPLMQGAPEPMVLPAVAEASAEQAGVGIELIAPEVSLAELRQVIINRERQITIEEAHKLGFRGKKIKKRTEANRITGRIGLNTEWQGGIEKAQQVFDSLRNEFKHRKESAPVIEPLENGGQRIFYEFEDGSSIQLRTEGKSGHPKVEITDVLKNIEEKITFK